MTTRIVREGAVYRLEGPVTMTNVESLVQEGRRQFQGAEVTVDMSGVAEADSSALSLLLQWMRDGADQGRRVSVTNLPAGLQSLAGLYGIDQLLTTARSTNAPRA